MENPFLQAYLKYVAALVLQFQEHIIRPKRLSLERFQRYLLEIGFVHQRFARWWEVEQNDRLHDLAQLGVRRDHVLRARPRRGTLATIKWLGDLCCQPDPHRPLRRAVARHVAHEVFAKQCEYIVSQMETFDVPADRLRFYPRHRDSRNDELMVRLGKRIYDAPTLFAAQQQAKAVVYAHDGLYEQFLDQEQVADAIRAIGAVRAA